MTSSETELLQETVDKYSEDFCLDEFTRNLPANLTSEYLLDHKGKLDKLLNIVSRKVSELILSHQPTYVEELQRIADLQKTINQSIRLCSQGRSYLRFLKNGTAKNGIKIIEHYKKRESLAKLLDSLNSIHQLRLSFVEIHNLIHIHEDFPRAIQMCKDGKSTLATFQEFKCMSELGSKFDDTIELIGDTILTKLCLSTDAKTYPRLLASYALLNRSRTQALKFFNAYHTSSVDELKMFLDNELWEALPVKNEFRLTQLKEFSFVPFGKSSYQLEHSRNFTSYEPLPLDKISLSTPSDTTDEEGQDEDEDDLELELNQDVIHEEGDPASTEPTSHLSLIRTSGPILTNSSLNVLRLFGRYIQMMTVLESISYEILMNIYNLLDHYIMAVYRRFGPDRGTNHDDRHMSPKLRIVIKSIKESLIGAQAFMDESGSKVDAINQSITDDLTDLETDQSLEERTDPKKAVAIESLIYLVNQLWNLQEYLETLIPAEMQPKLREQFNRTNSAVPDFLKARAELDTKTPILKS